MESIFPIIGAVFFLGFLANRLNKRREEESVNHHYDEVVAGMYNNHNNEEIFNKSMPSKWSNKKIVVRLASLSLQKMNKQ